MKQEKDTGNSQDQHLENDESYGHSSAEAQAPPSSPKAAAKAPENKVVRLLDKNPLGMTLPEMAGGPRQVKKIRFLRPLLAEAIRSGLVMPVSQRAGNTVYRLVKFLGPR